MLNGIIGGINSNQPVNNNKSSSSSTAAAGDVNFKNTFVELSKAAQLSVTDKGVKEELSFGSWRELEDSLYYDKEEIEEKALTENLKKLKKLLKDKLK
jgi:hypothetical protein